MKIPNLPARFRRLPGWMALLGIVIVYALLVVPTVNRLGIGWDEATDLWISMSYLSWNGLLFGFSRDLSQTRLPMFVVALVFHLLETRSLLIARSTTMLVGGLTLLGVYVYSREQFSHKTGLLATSLLAINPFFLSFARLAFTESDVYLACTLIWLLVAMARLQKANSLGYAALGGIMLGLSISAKATALVILPALFGAFVLRHILQERTANVSQYSIPARTVYFLVAVGIMILVAGVLLSRFLDAGDFSRIFQVLNYVFVWIVWLGILGWGVWYRHHTAHPIPLFAYLTALGGLTFVVFPPDHLVNSGIIQKLTSRAETEMTLNLALIGELAAMHLFTIFLKSTPLLGLGLLAGLAVSVRQWQRELTLPLLVVGIYGLGLLLLPLAQTFYTIPILPILSVLAANQLLRLYALRRKLALALILSGLIWWGVEMKQCYPDYHLNGYQWLGERPFFGRSSIGYRSIVYVPSDGMEQVMEWLNANAEAGQVAQLYIEPWHIVDWMAPNPSYKITDGFQESLNIKPDYVVIHIGALIWQGEGDDNPQGGIFRYPFDPEGLDREYAQVFVVRRAFDLEVASVWKRK